MTKPYSGNADHKTDQPEEELAAVRVQTDTASGHDTAKVDTTEPVGREANEPTDAEDTAGARDGVAAKAAISDDSASDQDRDVVEPSKTRRRIGWSRVLAFGLNGRRRGQGLQGSIRATKPHSGSGDATSDQPDKDSAGGGASELTDTEDTAGARDGVAAKAAISDDSASDQDRDVVEPSKTRRRIGWSRVLAYGVLPAAALLLALAAGFLKWHDSSVRSSQIARIEAVAAAKDSTIALLSYKPDTVENDLGAARGRLTGTFRDSYTQFTNDVVIPGSKQRQISATATVPDTAVVSASPNHAVVLLFVNQTVVIGTDTPSDTASSVRVTLDKIGGRWLISGFDPV